MGHRQSVVETLQGNVAMTEAEIRSATKRLKGLREGLDKATDPDERERIAYDIVAKKREVERKRETLSRQRDMLTRVETHERNRQQLSLLQQFVASFETVPDSEELLAEYRGQTTEIARASASIGMHMKGRDDEAEVKALLAPEPRIAVAVGGEKEEEDDVWKQLDDLD